MKMLRRYWYAFALLFVLTGLAVGSWAWSGYNTGMKASHNEAHAEEDEQPTATAEPAWWEGARLLVPSLHIDAPIEAVGVTPDGSMEVPANQQWDGVGWYKYGPVPGEKGSAVIDGHLDRPGGAPAVFWRLHELHAGEPITVVTHEGKKLQFRVTMLQKYEPQQAPLANIFGDKSGSHLNLITCAGQWIASEHQTTQRLVVYATLVE
jgi:sortase (surface protein transpeptidase)